MAVPLLDFSSVAGLVVGDLEAQEGVNGLQGFRVGAGNLDLRAAGRVVIEVPDLVAKFGHHRSAGRHGVVDEHRDVEVPGGEALDDVCEVHADLIPGGSIFAIVGGDVNEPAGFRKPEMVGRGLMGEAHGVVAAGGDAIMTGRVGRRGRGLLGG